MKKNDIQLLKSPDEWTEPLQIGFVYKTPELKKSKNKKKNITYHKVVNIIYIYIKEANQLSLLALGTQSRTTHINICTVT